jgi:hypothetical protein
MGSFNTTCFASRQTIAPHDECYVVPVVQARGHSAVQVDYRGGTHELYGISWATAYPCAFWEPCGGFIEAVYDDYGCVIPKDTATNRIRLVQFFRELLEKPVKVSEGENTVHDVPFDMVAFVDGKPELQSYLTYGVKAADLRGAPHSVFNLLLEAWEYVWERVQENRLFKGDWDEVLRPVQFSILHADAVKALIDEIPSVRYGKETLPQGEFLANAVNEALAFAEGSRSEDLFLHKLQRSIDRVGYFSGMAYPSERDELDACTGEFLAKQLSLDDYCTQIKPVMDVRYAIEGLAALNLRFSPLEYAGQDYANEVGRRYADFVAKVSSSVTEERIGNNMDDENDPD